MLPRIRFSTMFVYTNQQGKHDSHPDGAKQLKYLH